MNQSSTPEDNPLLGPVDLDWAREYVQDMSPELYLQQHTVPALLLSVRGSSDMISTEQINRGVTVQSAPNAESLSHFGLALVAKKPHNTLLPLMVTVGRSETVDIPLKFPTVSKLHAFFYQVGNDWVLVDAGSANGTFIEGLKLKPREPHTLISGQTIHFGYDVSAKFLLAKDLVPFLFE